MAMGKAKVTGTYKKRVIDPRGPAQQAAQQRAQAQAKSQALIQSKSITQAYKEGRISESAWKTRMGELAVQTGDPKILQAMATGGGPSVQVQERTVVLQEQIADLPADVRQEIYAGRGDYLIIPTLAEAKLRSWAEESGYRPEKIVRLQQRIQRESVERRRKIYKERQKEEKKAKIEPEPSTLSSAFYERAEQIYEKAGPAGQFAFAMQTLLTGKGRELIGTIGTILPKLPPTPTPEEIPSLVKPEYPEGIGELLYVPPAKGFEPTKPPKEVIVESLAEIIGTPYKPVRVKEAPRVKGVLPSEIEAMLGPSPPALEFAGTAFEAGVVEFVKSPVFEVELAALAGAGFTKLAAMDIAGKLITKGIATEVITVPGAKYVPYGVGAAITGLKLAEAEQLKVAGKPEAALGGLLTFGVAVGVAGLGAKVQKKYMISQELKKYTTALEVGEITYGAKAGRVESEALIFREGKLLSTAELKTFFQIAEPGKPFAVFTAAKVKPKVTGAEVQRFVGIAKARVTGKGFLKITDRGFTITRKGIMGTAESYLFGKDLKLVAGAEAYGITISEKGLYKSVAEVTGWTKKGIPFRQLGVSFLAKKAPPVDYYPKIPRPTTAMKPFGRPAVIASLEATTKQVSSVIGTAAVPKTPPSVGVLTGAIASFVGRGEMPKEKAAYPAMVEKAFPKTELAISPWARVKKPIIEEEEIFISAKAKEVVGVQALDVRQRAATMQEYGLTQESMSSTMQQLGMPQAVVSKEVVGIGLKQIPVQQQIQIQEQAQEQVQIQIQEQVQEQIQEFVFKPQPPVPVSAAIPFLLIPERRIPVRKKMLIPAKGFHTFIKRKQLKKAKGKYKPLGYVRVSKTPLPRTQALGLGASIVDRYTNRSFKIQPAKPAKRKLEPGITGLLKRQPVTQGFGLSQAWQSKKHKFRYKFRKGTTIPGILVEKSAHAIDSYEEKQGIPYKAARMRKAGVFAPSRGVSIQGLIMGRKLRRKKDMRRR